MKLELEMSDHTARAYGRVHKAGCRDLRDPIELGEHETLTSLAECISNEVWEETENDDVKLAPCVKISFNLTC